MEKIRQQNPLTSIKYQNCSFKYFRKKKTD